MSIKLRYPDGYDSKRYYTNPKIEVRKSKIHGVGVYARKSIAKHEVLEECHYIILKNAQWDKVPKPLWEYVFSWTNEMADNKARAAVVFGSGALYNSSKKPNADWETSVKKNRFIFFATRKIKKGDEILVDYGEDYWDTRDLKFKHK